MLMRIFSSCFGSENNSSKMLLNALALALFFLPKTACTCRAGKTSALRCSNRTVSGQFSIFPKSKCKTSSFFLITLFLSFFFSFFVSFIRTCFHKNRNKKYWLTTVSVLHFRCPLRDRKGVLEEFLSSCPTFPPCSVSQSLIDTEVSLVFSLKPNISRGP